MQNLHNPFYSFIGQYPFFFYQSHSQPNYLFHCGPTLPPKQAETRQSLTQAPKALNRPTEKPIPNDPKIKPLQSKKAIQKEKLQRKREKQDNYQRKKQKRDRNLPSNIFKNLANFIHISPTILSFVKKLIPAQLDVTAENLILKFKEAIKYGQSYIRPGIVKSLCREGSFTKEEAQVFRILLRNFLLVELPVVILNQPKLKRKQRSEYIKMGRKLFGQLTRAPFND